MDHTDDSNLAYGATVASTVADVLRSRRTNLQVKPDDEIARADIELLIELATWAPNHKRTWPWRFTVLQGSARARFGEALASAAQQVSTIAADKRSKLPTKYLRSPVVLLVWTHVSSDPVVAREDRDATAAAVQNILIAATGLGMASYWGSLPEVLWDGAREFAGQDSDADPVALIYLGWPIGKPLAPPRGPADTTWLTQ